MIISSYFVFAFSSLLVLFVENVIIISLTSIVLLTMSSKSFLIKDILSENGDDSSSSSSSSTTSGDDESSLDHKEIFLQKPIDLRRFFKHPLYPIPLRPSSLLLGKPTSSTSSSLRHTHRLDKDSKNSPLDALFEMTKKTFDKSNPSKSYTLNSTLSRAHTHERFLFSSYLIHLVFYGRLTIF